MAQNRTGEQLGKKVRDELSAKFKAQIVLEAIQGKRTIEELAKRHKIDGKQIAAWKRHAVTNLAKVFEEKRETPGERQDAVKRPAARRAPGGHALFGGPRVTRMLAGSYRKPPGTTAVRKVDDSATVRLTVVLKPSVPYPASGVRCPVEMNADVPPNPHRTDQRVIDRVVQYAQENGLQVELADGDRHIVKLVGTYRQARKAFRPEKLALYRRDGKEFVGRSGHLSVPADLSNDIVAVMGFDRRPIARPFLQVGAGGAQTPYDPAEVARRYRFPTGVDGSGQTIALIQLGGGYETANVNSYFADKHITRTGSLRSQPNRPTGGGTHDNEKGDGEVHLDIEIAGSIAPGANIVVYFGEPSAKGLYDAIEAAVADPSTTVVSISWGNSETEDDWGEGNITAIDQVFLSKKGYVTFCAASGDYGSAGSGDTGGSPIVNFPASSPNVLGCGGTTLPRGGDEIAWNKGLDKTSGGGFSSHFPLPPFQFGHVYVPHRGVPDVSGNADFDTGYNVNVNGNNTVLGGTSAVAPLWAGLIALINQGLGGNVGFINDVLYRNSGAFTDITSGDNGRWVAVKGWDPVTGLGTPLGDRILAALQAEPPTA
jgi:kumamolisin